MMNKGLLKEANDLYPFRHLSPLQTVGYSELFENLEGKISLPAAVELIKRNSRRYAKRQMTWFRKKTYWNRFYAKDPQAIIKFVTLRMQADLDQEDRFS